jgi:hypothetical protein
LLSIAGLTALVGFCLDLIIVPAQTRMQERSPDEMRGRVLALYQVLFNGGAIPVMLFMGGLTDLLGIVAVIDMLVAFSLGAALVTLLRTLGHGRGGSPRGSRKATEQPSSKTPEDEDARVSKPPALSN